MTRLERLSSLIGMSIDTIEREIDDGMIDILITPLISFARQDV